MIGTHSPVRSFVIFMVFALAVTGLALVWGCNSTPVSVPGIGSSSGTPSFSEVPVPRDHKSDVATTVGTIDGVDYAAMRLLVDGLWFRADAFTEVELDRCDSGCVFADIVVGDAVKIKHARVPDSDGDYYARSIEIENEEDEPDEPETVESEGMVDAVDGGSFQVTGVWFWTDAATGFEFDDCAHTGPKVGDDAKVEHAAIDTGGFGFYVFNVELHRDCEEEEEDE